MAAAIAKMYERSTTEFIQTPSRRRSEITRSRHDVERDRHYSETGKHADYIYFRRHVGPRAYKEAEHIRGTDLVQRGEKYYVHIRSGKGGRPRDAEIAGAPEEVQRVVDMMRAAGENHVFQKAPRLVDAHALRAEYAQRIYAQYARPLETLSKKQKYYCRGDMRDKVYDRHAMYMASLSLGHNRISVIASHYMWKKEAK